MTVYQIWGAFPRDDKDHERPTTVSMFEKDQLMGDGVKRHVDFERELAAEFDEELVLLKEFRPAPDVWLTKDAELEVARQIFNVFMDGWWRVTHDEDGAKHDRSADEQAAAGTPLDV